MIRVTLGSTSLQMPTEMDELSSLDGRRFIRLCQALGSFEEGRMDFDQMRVAAVIAMLGLDYGKLSLDKGYLNENIFRLVPYTDFLYEIKEEGASRRCSLKMVLHEQLLPTIGDLCGYRFSLQGGTVIDCSITAEQYVDAVSLMKAFSAGSDRTVLSRLCAALYCPAPYDPQKAAVLDTGFTEAEMLAVYYNFRGILEWIKRIPTYDLIFRSSDDGAGEQRSASPLGLSGSIFAIAKAGYGDIASVRQLDLFSYLGILVQMTMDSIRSLAASQVKPTDIAYKLHLQVDQVLSVTSQNS